MYYSRLCGLSTLLAMEKPWDAMPPGLKNRPDRKTQWGAAPTPSSTPALLPAAPYANGEPARPDQKTGVVCTAQTPGHRGTKLSGPTPLNPATPYIIAFILPAFISITAVAATGPEPGGAFFCSIPSSSRLLRPYIIIVK